MSTRELVICLQTDQLTTAALFPQRMVELGGIVSIFPAK